MSTLYSNAIISVRSSKMLNADRIRRMVASNTASDAAKVLFECGYDENLLTTQPDRDDLIISTERARTIEKFNEYCFDANLKYCVLASFDYHNAQALYGNDRVTNDALYGLGNIPVEKLRVALAKKNYAGLPDKMASALVLLDKNDTPSPSMVEVELNRALYADILARASGLVLEYYRAEIDILNMRAAAKAKIFGGNYTNMFVAGGTVDETSLKSLLTKNPRSIKSAIANVNYARVLDALVYGIENANLVEFENVAGEYLVKLSSTGADNLFSINLLFHWFIKKIEEMRIVKTILMGKKFGKTKEELRDELKGLL